ncbi:MAG: hypothetical protein AAF821_22115 [Cyanobacteria bacterium P01_D01_bin.156]
MGNTSEHIEQQLSKLQNQTADIATDLEALVDNYLEVLSQASKRQLVLAAYHICTQIYPDRFLELSLSQKNRLQQRLRELGNSIHTQLQQKWETAKRLSLQPAEEDGLAVIRQLFLEATSIREQSSGEQVRASEQGTDASPNNDDDTSLSDQPETSTENAQEEWMAEIQTLMSNQAEVVITADEPNDGPMQPAQLMRRQILIEKGIRDILKETSETANDTLQTADVMPDLPQALLNAASESERLGHVPIKTPNLVRLAIKILHEPSQKDSKDNDHEKSEPNESEQWPEDTDITAAIITRDDNDPDDNSHEGSADDMPRLLQLESLPNFVMIHLRLSEIEFAETNVAIWRSRIRKKMDHLKRVGHAYRAAEKQLAIAQAEDAWRASWTND